ncbi:MAG: hypothetical protein JNK78_08785 [Planctomycetes bacterium]|nr:hypothetical protein [Planctomycetota bacterium]
MEAAGIVVVAIVVALAIRPWAGSMDGDRITDYIRGRGGKLLEKTWSPFGRGWFGERSDRIYEIEYEDRDGQRRAATAKTSLFTGVCLTEDRVVRRWETRAAEVSEIERLRTENAQLRERLGRDGNPDA